MRNPESEAHRDRDRAVKSWNRKISSFEISNKMNEFIVKFVKDKNFKAMNIESMKLIFMEQYMKIKDETIIEKLWNTLNEEVSKTNRLSVSETERQAIRKGMKDVKEGNTHTHEQVMAKMRRKYPNLIK